MARVLIIDDSPDILQLLGTFFERRTSHRVLSATDGRTGLELAMDQRPDLALVDVMMPVMDGYEVVRRLRADPKTSGMGIIILTARGQSVDEAAALKAGADLHLPKPVNLDALEEAVEAVLAKTHPSGPPKMVVPVMGLRGGIGVTTVAVNLAALLQQVAPTVLWDLSPASGHAAIFLGMQPKTHWGAYLRDTTQPVRPLIRQHPSGLRVFCAPPTPGVHGWFDAETSAAALQSLAETAQFVVVDMPSVLDEAVSPMLRAATRILLITGDDPPAIQTTLTTMQVLRGGSARVVLARSGARPDRLIETQTLEQTMRLRIHVDLPHDPNQPLALSKGVPLALAKPDSPLIAALKRVAQLLLAP